MNDSGIGEATPPTVEDSASSPALTSSIPASHPSQSPSLPPNSVSSPSSSSSSSSSRARSSSSTSSPSSSSSSSSSETPLTPPPTPPSLSSPRQMTFQEAVLNGDTMGLLRILEEREGKVNINLFDTEGQTALHQSCLKGNLELVKLLVRFGADVRLANRDGWNPLHIAAYGGHNDIFLFLMTVPGRRT